MISSIQYQTLIEEDQSNLNKLLIQYFPDPFSQYKNHYIRCTNQDCVKITQAIFKQRQSQINEIEENYAKNNFETNITSLNDSNSDVSKEGLQKEGKNQIFKRNLFTIIFVKNKNTNKIYNYQINLQGNNQTIQKIHSNHINFTIQARIFNITYTIIDSQQHFGLEKWKFVQHIELIDQSSYAIILHILLNNELDLNYLKKGEIYIFKGMNVQKLNEFLCECKLISKRIRPFRLICNDKFQITHIQNKDDLLIPLWNYDFVPFSEINNELNGNYYDTFGIVIHKTSVKQLLNYQEITYLLKDMKQDDLYLIIRTNDQQSLNFPQFSILFIKQCKLISISQQLNQKPLKALINTKELDNEIIDSEKYEILKQSKEKQLLIKGLSLSPLNFIYKDQKIGQHIVQEISLWKLKCWFCDENYSQIWCIYKLNCSIYFEKAIENCFKFYCLNNKNERKEIIIKSWEKNQCYCKHCKESHYLTNIQIVYHISVQLYQDDSIFNQAKLSDDLSYSIIKQNANEAFLMGSDFIYYQIEKSLKNKTQFLIVCQKSNNVQNKIFIYSLESQKIN